ncbi:tetratricopeptide repeat protein [Nibricoccus sp. IMCC34717]|uniref:tetratricopeptide repeat protein n=1 Tax=Nibricoccus sp. IMCC34717 TaxID=3034021 RepID=UPI00384BEA69
MKVRGYWIHFVFLCALIAGVVWAYSNTRAAGLYLDDEANIARNRSLGSLVESLSPPEGIGFSGRPVANFSFALNQLASGDDIEAMRWTNIGLHILCAILVFVLFVKVLKQCDGIESGLAPIVSSIVGLLWAFHPVQTQSVTYLSQRTEIIAALFFLMSLGCYLYGRFGSGGWRFLVLSVLAAWLSVGAKEFVIVLPILVLAIEWIASGRELSVRVFERWWFHLGLATTWVVVAIKVWTTFSTELTSAHGSSLSAMIGDRLGYLAGYVRLSFWPSPLVFDYGANWREPEVTAISVGALGIGLFFFTIWTLVRRKPIALLGVWFFGLAGSTLMAIVVDQPFSENRLYLALLAPCLLVVLAVFRLPRVFAIPILVTLLTAAVGATRERNEVYRNEKVLAADTFSRVPNNQRAQLSLAIAYERDQLYEKAIPLLEDLIRKVPEQVDAFRSLARIFQNNPFREKDAIAAYKRAVELAPKSAPEYLGLGNVLSRSEENTAAAVEAYRTAIRLRPNAPEARLNLAEMFVRRGRLAEAEHEYEEMEKVRPDWPRLYLDWADAIVMHPERRQEARAKYEKALTLDPKLAQAHFKLALIAAEKAGDSPEVEGYYRAALAADPNHIASLYNLGLLLYRDAKRCVEAEAYFKRVLEVDGTIKQAEEMIRKVRAKVAAKAG